MRQKKAKPAPLRGVRLRGGYMGKIQTMVREKMLPFQWEALNDRVEGATPSHCIRNFRSAAGEVDAPHAGFVFQDSDLAKWLEAAAYSLTLFPDSTLEARCDEVFDLLERAQMPDGYLDTYYQLTDISKRFTNLRDNHELYCAGHMLEAAVAYYEATGKPKLLDIMRRFVNCIAQTIGPEEGKIHGYPGHEELELALCRLHALNNDEDALRLAAYLIDERGEKPNFFQQEAASRGDKPMPDANLRYHQAHAPVRDQQTLDGHSVRALYLLAGMIDVARETNDVGLLTAGKRLFDNVTEKRMYITGGVGSTHHGEAFTFDYHLPADTAYAETCASIALIFAAQRLLCLEQDGRYADVIERALYNTCMAGMSLSGDSFFYVNPLEVVPEASRLDPGKRHVLPQRPAWFGCACCPPNLARLIMSLGMYQYTIAAKNVYMNLYFQGTAEMDVQGQMVKLDVETKYPRNGHVRIKTGQGSYNLHLHIPGWCRGYTLTRNGIMQDVQPHRGYVALQGPFDMEEIVLDLHMQPERNYANSGVRDAAGCTAVTMGPLVYCLEGVDNGDNLHLVRLPEDAMLTPEDMPGLLGGITVISAGGVRETGGGTSLYTTEAPSTAEPVLLTFIPYAVWANRGECEMRVWVRAVQ